MNEIIEEWRPICDYEGLYEVSNLGRVKSLGNDKSKKDKILKQEKTKNGYLRVNLWKEKKVKHYMVHRLVAKAFISNPNKLPMVNHKNEIKNDNRIENLEWCDSKYNNNYGNRIKKTSDKLLNRKDLSKPIIQLDLTGKIVNEYKSIKEAARCNNLFNTNIGKVLLGKNKTCGGYIWKYKNEGEEN